MELRLIDATALKAEFDPNDKIEFDPIGVRYYIETAPTIDPLHTLGACYCRECKKFYPDADFCEQHQSAMKPTDFCSYGIPKEQEETK